MHVTYLRMLRVSFITESKCDGSFSYLYTHCLTSVIILPLCIFNYCDESSIVWQVIAGYDDGNDPRQFPAVAHRPYSKLVRTRYKVTNTVWLWVSNLNLFYPNSSDFLLLMSLLCLHWCRCFTCLRLSLKHANHPRKVTYVNFTRRLKAAIITYKQASHIILILLRFRGLGVWRNIRGKWSYNIWV